VFGNPKEVQLQVRFDSSRHKQPKRKLIGGTMKRYRLNLLAVLSCVVTAPLFAANIVQDPSFEAGGPVNCTGSAACSPLFPEWTFINPVGHLGYGIQNVGHSGSDSAFFASASSFYAIIEQSLGTAPGQFYTLSFWLDTHFDNSNADFQVYWNGSLVYDNPSGTDPAHQFLWTQFTVAGLKATGSATVLEFTGFNGPSRTSLDDVAIVAAPESATWIATCAGALALALIPLCLPASKPTERPITTGQ
jgi:hypothetical protein